MKAQPLSPPEEGAPLPQNEGRTAQRAVCRCLARDAQCSGRAKQIVPW
jgi:hypothetical protein